MVTAIKHAVLLAKQIRPEEARPGKLFLNLKLGLFDVIYALLDTVAVVV